MYYVITKVDIVIINSDCKNGMKKIKDGTTELGYIINEMVNELMRITNCVFADYRHVKAHVAIKDSRTYINDWCDKEAKYHMRNGIKNKIKK